MSSSIINKGIETILIEAEAIKNLQQFINADFEKAVQLVNAAKGRLVISGIGKSAIVAQKIVATLNSTGTASLFMHAADAIHGDLGMIQDNDVVMIISKSGESPEIKVLIPLIKNFGNTIIAMAGNAASYLALNADVLLNTTVSVEACPNNLAPTSSTTAQMVMGDALAVSLMQLKGFTGNDFAKFHPGGALGKKLYLRVDDLSKNNNKPAVKKDASIKEVIVEITGKRLGATAVINDDETLAGLITDGDLRRMMERDIDFSNTVAETVMSKNPSTISPDALAVEALDMMRKKDINQLVVINQNNTYAGIVHLHDIIKEGLI